MTKEEAHRILSNGLANAPSEQEWCMAFKMAIQALSQEPTDAVSREAVNILVDELARAISDERCHIPQRGRDTGHIMHDILDLPSVNPQPCDDAISREEIMKVFTDIPNYTMTTLDVLNIIEQLPSVTQKSGKWIPVSERLPEAFSFVNCTCHSLIDDREDWVVETCYLPQLPDSPYSDWGNIPMLNMGDCEVVAWMHRDIPKPYKVEPQERSE